MFLHHRNRWLITLALLYLACGQFSAFAKTLLEQYLNCDGFEEFAFYVEYPGQTNQFPNVYWSGAYQDNNFLIIRHTKPTSSIPDKLTPEDPCQLSIHFDRLWWVVDANLTGYERKVWEDKGIPEEESNEVKSVCLSMLNTLYGNLLNYGLFHSGINMNPNSGNYNNLQTLISVDYSIIEKNKTGQPNLIVAKSTNLERKDAPVTWKREIRYSSNDDGLTLPCEILFYSIYSNGEKQLKSRIVIEKLIPAFHKLPKTHFFRTAFEETTGFTNYGAPAVFNVRSNQLIGFDPKSNPVVRMAPDDPRLLELPDRKNLVWRYWLSAGLIISLFLILKLFYKNK